MKSNHSVIRSKINTHSLKAQNFRFWVWYEDENGKSDITDVPMDVILSNEDKHLGIHKLFYVLDDQEIASDISVNQEEIESVVKQVSLELGGVPVEFTGVTIDE